MIFRSIMRESRGFTCFVFVSFWCVMGRRGFFSVILNYFIWLVCYI